MLEHAWSCSALSARADGNLPLQLPKLLPSSTSIRLLMICPFWKMSASTVDVQASTFELCILLHAQQHRLASCMICRQCQVLLSTLSVQPLQLIDRRLYLNSNSDWVCVCQGRKAKRALVWYAGKFCEDTMDCLLVLLAQLRTLWCCLLQQQQEQAGHARQ